MIKLTIITLSIVFSIILFSSSTWFEQEQLKIEKINKTHLSDIRKLKKISQINKWLDEKVKPMLKITPHNANIADDNLVRFFDENSQELNLKVSRYIYSDDVTRNLLMKYSINRYELDQLKSLMNLRYKEGFLQFQELKMDTKVLSGEIELIQAFYGDNNASKF